jgi:hypothetical protein
MLEEFENYRKKFSKFEEVLKIKNSSKKPERV